MKSFIKWAGGKKSISQAIISKFPEVFDVYVEPFLGGGAVFLEVVKKYPEKEFILNDCNRILINTWVHIKENPDALMGLLDALKEIYEQSPTKKNYEDLRGRFNDLTDRTILKSAMFILLNKICYNGLWRVNSSGKFNTPWGNYEKCPSLYTSQALKTLSEYLKHVDIFSRDYRDVPFPKGERTLIYLDPPYFDGFTGYVPNGFTIQRLKELILWVDGLSKQGCKVIISHSAKDYGRIEALFTGYNIDTVNVSRSINSDGLGRGKVREILITNY